MLIKKDHLKQLLLLVLRQRLEQGCDIDECEFAGRIETASHSYDALYALALELRSPPVREDWPYQEPVAWDDIADESENLEPTRKWSTPDLKQASENVRAGFLGAVCGCMLGKPIEVDPSLAELRRAGQELGEWPLRDYISQALLDRLGRRHESAGQTTRENIRFVAADDDLHYRIMGMLLLEQHGLSFNQQDMYQLWSMNIAPLWTWGPERTALLMTGIGGHHVLGKERVEGRHDVLMLNPGDELCGAIIRADAYGYACPGNPDLAAWLAWKDASYTHIKTGVYGSMFIAAVIALCQAADNTLKGDDRLGIIEEALRRIPARTRFATVVRDSLEKVAASRDWLAGYEAIHGKYREYTHCRVYQEIGTLINTLKFAQSIDHGICMQVSQGNDTDSFGAISGSILGCFFGPGYLDDRWLRPFCNRIFHAMADFHEYELDSLADRMSRLPAKIFGEYRKRGISL